MTWKERFRYLYLKILRTNDTPHRIALGIAIGIFSGVMPGSGPVFAIIFAFVLRANKAAALLGAFAVNTWISFLLLAPAVKVGSLIFGVKWTDLEREFDKLRYHFSWEDLFKDTFLGILIPLVAGFFICSFAISAIVYGISYLFVKYIKEIKRKRCLKPEVLK